MLADDGPEAAAPEGGAGARRCRVRPKEGAPDSDCRRLERAGARAADAMRPNSCRRRFGGCGAGGRREVPECLPMTMQRPRAPEGGAGALVYWGSDPEGGPTVGGLTPKAVPPQGFPEENSGNP